MKKLFYFSVVALLLMMFSCKVSSKKGQEKVDEATDNVISQVDAVSNSEFRDAVSGFANIGFEIDYKSTKKKDFANSITQWGVYWRDALIKKHSDIFNLKCDAGFCISDYAGTYTWQASDSTWSHDPSPSDKIILIFPSNNSNSNNCKFIWSEYTENGDGLPTRIYAELYKDDDLIAKLDYTAEFNSDEFPTYSKTELLLSPIKLKLDYNYENDIIDLSASLKYKNRTIDELNTELYTTDNNECDWVISKGSGVFKTYKIDKAMNTGVLLKIKYKFDYSDLLTIPNCEWTSEDVDKHTKINVYTSSDRLIGKIVLLDEDYEDYDFDCDFEGVIIFNDGTKQPVCKYIDRIDEAIENAFDSLDD